MSLPSPSARHPHTSSTAVRWPPSSSRTTARYDSRLRISLTAPSSTPGQTSSPRSAKHTAGGRRKQMGTPATTNRMEASASDEGPHHNRVQTVGRRTRGRTVRAPSDKAVSPIPARNDRCRADDASDRNQHLKAAREYVAAARVHRSRAEVHRPASTSRILGPRRKARPRRRVRR